MIKKPNTRLQAARKERGWSQAELAERIGVGALEIGRWERGNAFPQPLHRQQLLDTFGLSAQELGLVQLADDQDSRSEDNAFSFNEPLHNPRSFYGRERERKALVDRTKKRAPTSIAGPGRIGKTWLVQYLHLSAQELLGPHVRIGYLDASSPICNTQRGFVEEALQRLGLPAATAVTGLIDLQRSLETTWETSPCVLCLDKFEYLMRNREQFPADFFQGLRSMAQASLLTLIVITKEPLYDLFSRMVASSEEGDLTSFFPNIFEQITLKPFCYEETQQFIESKSKKTDLIKEECDYFWRYGHVGEQLWSPILLQGIGKILLEQNYQQRRKIPHFRQYFEQRFSEMCRTLGMVWIESDKH
jgi:transcriptional regulator with XRE-family HTH domain